MEDFIEAPSPAIPYSSKEFLNEIDIEHFATEQEFAKRSKELFGIVPLSGIALDIKILRNDNDHAVVGYKNPIILVSDEHYSRKYGKDFSDMLPYDLEHEKWEMYYASKKGFNPDVIDMKGGVQNLHFGRAHYLAIRKALRSANNEGRLDDYLEWVGTQFEALEEKGHKGVKKELDYYQREAIKLKITNSQEF
jgi:hypothetical protein